MSTTHPLNILHTEWSQGWGGQEIRILAESRALQARGHRVVIACRPDATLWQRAQEAGIPVAPIPFKHTLDVSSILRLRKLIHRGGFDLVHTHSSIDSWCGGFAGRLAGVPVVRSRHLSSPVKARANNRFLYKHLANAVITSGETIRQHLLNDLRCAPEHVVSIPAGADHQRFRPDVDGTSVRQECGYEAEHFVIGIVAVLRSWKGHRVLIEAIGQLRGHFPGLRLLIAGDGPGRASLGALVEERGLHDCVCFAGHREDIPHVIRALDCLVLPSLKNEATSQAIPQAMLSAIPVIASTAGGLPEIVHNGETGLLVPPGNPEALAAAIARMASESTLREHCAANALAYARTHLTFEKQMDDTEAVYHLVLGVTKQT